MFTLFVDTSHLLAVFHEDDTYHGVALAVVSELATRPDVRFVLTPLVFAEFLASVSRLGSSARVTAADFVTELRTRPAVTIVPLTDELFDAALDLYRRRPDKRYSLTDCVSMSVCTDLGITEVLTADHDFESEGFTILLGDE